MTEKAVCVTYRGQNGFGGMNRAQAVVALDSTYAYSSEEPEFHKAWNRDCAGTGKDLTPYAQWNIEYADRALR